MVAAPNNRASAESRTLGASSRVSTRRASLTVHSTGGRGQAMLAALGRGAKEADVESGVVRDEHRAAGELEKCGSTDSIFGASQTIAEVMPVSCDDLRRDAPAGVDQGGQLAEHLTAAHLDRADLGDGVDVVAVAAVARPPVVSRSTTTNVVSLKETSASGSTSAKLSWLHELTVGRHRQRSVADAAGLSVVAVTVRVTRSRGRSDGRDQGIPVR